MTDRLYGILLAIIMVTFAALFVAATGPARADQIVASTGAPLNIDVRKGTLIRVDSPVSTVFVADPAIADIQIKSPTLVYIFAKRVGETIIYGVTEEEDVVLSRIIRVNHNLSRLQSALNQFIPEGRVQAASLDGALVLRGAVESPSEAEDARRIAASFVGDPATIVNKLDVTGPNQVHLKVKIAELSRDVIKQLGINWETVIGSAGGFAFGLGTGRDFVEIIDGLANVQRADVADSLFFSFSNGTQDLNVLLDALDDEGLGTILAEPSLTAMSGETAKFLAGGEFPVPVAQDDNTITIQFKEFGVALAFTPTVLNESRINLKVAPEVSELSEAGAIRSEEISVPSLTTRRAETTVELGSGQSFAIAGLLQSSMRESVRKFPGLGDLPVIGRLFRSDQFRRDETELVILVTPYIVRPVSGRMASPTDGFTPADDEDRILHGHLYEQGVATPQPAPVAPHGRPAPGPVGFILE